MFKNKFHIQAEKGLINDPNGLIYFNDEYHVFFQHNPTDCTHANKHWSHVKSSNLLDWKNLPTALSPVESYEKNGCYSGSAIAKDGKLHLFYTGNIKEITKDGEIKREAYQCLAISSDGINFEKLGPVIDFKDLPSAYTAHVRDPKVYFDGLKYNMVLGAQRQNLTGTIILFQSDDLKKWHFCGELLHKHFGFMCECPDLIKLDNQEILLFSPQGLEANGMIYNNLYQSGYIVNRNEDNFVELDRGFDFYAPQTFTDEAGRTVLIAWLGMGLTSDLVETSPTIAEGRLHSLTLPRVLSLKDGRLYQNPHPNLELLRKKEIVLENLEITSKIDLTAHNMCGRTYELIVDFTKLDSDFVLNLRTNKAYYTKLHFDFKRKIFNLDRTHSTDITNYQGIRSCQLYILDYLQVFVDNDCIEVYINHGQEVFTANIYSDDSCVGLSIEAKLARLSSLKFYTF